LYFSDDESDTSEPSFLSPASDGDDYNNSDNEDDSTGFDNDDDNLDDDIVVEDDDDDDDDDDDVTATFVTLDVAEIAVGAVDNGELVRRRREERFVFCFGFIL